MSLSDLAHTQKHHHSKCLRRPRLNPDESVGLHVGREAQHLQSSCGAMRVLTHDFLSMDFPTEKRLFIGGGSPPTSLEEKVLHNVLPAAPQAAAPHLTAQQDLLDPTSL